MNMSLSDEVRANEEIISDLVDRIAKCEQSRKEYGHLPPWPEQCDAFNRCDLDVAYKRSQLLLAMTWGEKLGW